MPAPSGPLLSLTTPGVRRRPGHRHDVEARGRRPAHPVAGRRLARRASSAGRSTTRRLFRLTTKDGVVLIIDRFGGLQSLTDRNGNKLIYSADGVTLAVDRPPARRSCGTAPAGSPRSAARAGSARSTRYSACGRPSQLHGRERRRRRIHLQRQPSAPRGRRPGDTRVRTLHVRARRPDHLDHGRRGQHDQPVVRRRRPERDHDLAFGPADDVSQVRRRRQPRDHGGGLQRPLAGHELRVRRRGPGDEDHVAARSGRDPHLRRRREHHLAHHPEEREVDVRVQRPEPAHHDDRA